MNLEIEFVPGEKYRNRRGTYEVLELLPAGRMKVRYLDDEVVAEFDQAQQSRIIANIQLEEKVQEQQAASAKPVKASSRSSATAAPAKAKPGSPPVKPASSASPASPARPAPATPVRSPVSSTS